MISIDEMEKLSKLINNYLSESNQEKDYIVLHLHGRLNLDEQQKVFDIYYREDLPVRRIKTKIILATKIAECSLTIDGVGIVIDSGKERDSFYDPQRKMTRLETKNLSKVSAKQRKGRAGRT